MMKKSKLLIQIDCDSESALLNHYLGDTHHDQIIESNYYIALKRFYHIFESYDYKATLFVMGEDMKYLKKIKLLELGLLNGYEVANHSFSHPAVFKSNKHFDVRKDIEKAHIAIQSALGVECLGFRTPNFEISTEVLKVLQELHYLYDCSVFPTPYTNMIRWIKNDGKLRGKKGGYLGDFRYALSPTDAYFPDICYPWKKNQSGKDTICIQELPISVYPRIRIPCHASYLLAMPKKLRECFLRSLFFLYSQKEVPLVYVFHLAELVDDIYLMGDEKKYYPNLKERMAFVDLFCSLATEHFDSMITKDYISEKKEGNCEK